LPGSFILRLLVKPPTAKTVSGTNEKAISWVVHPADGLGSFRLPEASDGDGYNDPDNNNDYDGEGRGNSACEAVEHCQKFQFKRKVFEMQVLVRIKDIYDCICHGGIRGEKSTADSSQERLYTLTAVVSGLAGGKWFEGMAL
jgi:hypothetical protein